MMKPEAQTATAMMIDQRARGGGAYRKSAPFRRRVDMILARAMQERGPIDPHHADRDAHEVAREALVMMLQAIYEDDGEIRNLKAERDAALAGWEKSLHLAPMPRFIVQRGDADPQTQISPALHLRRDRADICVALHWPKPAALRDEPAGVLARA